MFSRIKWLPLGFHIVTIGIIEVIVFRIGPRGRKDQSLSVQLDRKVQLVAKDAPVKYSLLGEISHHGDSILKGHYTASVALGSSTFNFNDNKVSY